MRASTKQLFIGFALAIALGVTGCAGSPPAAPPIADPPPAVPGNSTPADPGANGGGTNSIDPAWPWPQDLPRPSVPISSEFSGPNIMSEDSDSGVYTLQFTVPSVAHAQAYADELAAAGIDWMVSSTLEEDDKDANMVTVVAWKENYIATLTVNKTTLLAEMSFIGVFK